MFWLRGGGSAGSLNLRGLAVDIYLRLKRPSMGGEPGVLGEGSGCYRARALAGLQAAMEGGAKKIEGRLVWAGVLVCFEQRASQAAKEREVQVVESSSRPATGPRQGPRSSQGHKPACSEVIAKYAHGKMGGMGTWRHISKE